MQSPTKRRRPLGDLGERLAARHLAGEGHRILERNFRCKLGEIDLISRCGDWLVFTEVKSAVHSEGYRPGDHLNDWKKRRVRRLAEYYLALNPPEEMNLRFDLVEVVFPADRRGRPEIQHFENAF
jgi:putative endonuclease